jgi:hypothetical protein
MVTQKMELRAQALHFVNQIEHGFDQGRIKTVQGPYMLYSPNGMDGFFSECHDSIRRLKDRSHKSGAAIHQNGTAGDTRDMSGNIETVQFVGFRLK